MKWCAPLLTILLGATPALAETYDDATCGAIAEYVMDLAYDQGAPAEMAPEGRGYATSEGCVLTQISLSLEEEISLIVEQIFFGGDGLEDWVTGQGWAAKLSVGFDNAYFSPNIPNHPAVEWAMRIQMQRSAADGTIDLSWDKNSGVLSLDLLEVTLADYSIRLSGHASGVRQGPMQVNIPTVRFHDLDIDLGFAGMFEAYALNPLAAALLVGHDDPGAAFDALVAHAKSYVAALPQPQVDARSIQNLEAFLNTLPSPTGHLQIALKAREDVQVISAVPLVAELAAPTPEGLAGVVKNLLGSARLTVQWTPGQGG